MRVLLVEDERTLARAVARGLEAEGMLTDVAHDGLDGLDRALVGDYDVVVLDIMLPGRNGYDVCKELRAAQVWTPVLMLTAKDALGDKIEGLNAGADDYLTKLRVMIRENAAQSLMFAEMLQAFVQDYTQRLEARMRGVDAASAEAQKFMESYERLSADFENFAGKISFADPLELKAM